MGSGQMNIAHGRADMAVAEQALDGMDIDAGFQQMRRTSVAQGVNGPIGRPEDRARTRAPVRTGAPLNLQRCYAGSHLLPTGRPFARFPGSGFDHGQHLPG